MSTAPSAQPNPAPSAQPSPAPPTPAWVRHYQPGVPAEIELPTESLVALVERSVAEGGDAVATEFF